MKAMEQMVKARTALVLDHFFFGSLALKLQLVEDASCKTAATNGIILKFNPDWISKLNMDQTKGLICHEVMHCALAHHVRRSGRDLRTWNEACDYAVNPLIVDAKMQLPINEALIDPAFNNMNVDHIFSELMKRQLPPQDDNDSNDEKSDDKEENNDPGGCGEIEDYPGEPDENGEQKESGASDSEKEQQAQEWQIAATQAAQQAKSRGTLPAGIEKLIKKLNEPKVNWREALHRFVDQVSRNDYTFRRVNTRFVGRGICLPSLYNEELPPIDLVIDTSASLSDEELSQFAAEIDDILTQYNTTCRVTYCDTKVQSTEEFTQENRPVQLSAKGGGGTNFEPGIQHAVEQEEQPVCLIYLTDLECSSYGKAPDFPVLWVCTQADVPEYYGNPPFGEVIKMQR